MYMENGEFYLRWLLYYTPFYKQGVVLGKDVDLTPVQRYTVFEQHVHLLPEL